MDLRQLRYFVALAEERHFGRAAQSLHIVQPALSMQIRALEEEVGGALLLRTSRHVELTQAGEVLLTEARRTLAQAERTRTQVQASLQGVIGSVRIGFAGNAVLAGKLVNDLRDFRQRHPDVAVELHEMGPQLQVEALQEGRLDVGYAPSLGLQTSAQLAASKVGSWPFLVALSTDHPLAKKKRITLASLAKVSLLLYAAGDGDGGLAYLQQWIGTTAVPSRQVASTLSVLALAAAGVGVALVPAPCGALDIPHIAYRPLADNNITSDLVLLHRSAETSGAVLAFVALARPAATERRGRSAA